jgi:hypothetical protein
MEHPLLHYYKEGKQTPLSADPIPQFAQAATKRYLGEIDPQTSPRTMPASGSLYCAHYWTLNGVIIPNSACALPLAGSGTKQMAT